MDSSINTLDLGDYNYCYTCRKYLQNVDTDTMANLVCNVFEWDNRDETKKYIQMCMDIYYPKMSKDKCWITNILPEAFRQLAESKTTKYFQNHEYLQDIQSLNVIIECIIDSQFDLTTVDMGNRSAFLMYTLGWMIGDEYLATYEVYVEDNTPRFEALYQSITHENDPLYQTYGMLAKQLMNNIFKMFQNNACIFRDQMAEIWDMNDDDIDESVQLMNKIVVACKTTV